MILHHFMEIKIITVQRTEFKDTLSKMMQLVVVCMPDDVGTFSK